MRMNTIVFLSTLVFGLLIFYGCGAKDSSTIKASQFPVNESDTVKVDLQEINDEKIVLYIGEQGKIIVGYHVLMESLDKFIKANDLTDDKSLKKELFLLAEKSDTVNVEKIIQDYKLRERLDFRFAELLEKGEAIVYDIRNNEMLNYIMIEHFVFALHKLAGRGGRRFLLPDGTVFLEVIDWMS